MYIKTHFFWAYMALWGALGGCDILTQGVGIICPLADTFYKNVCLATHVQAIFLSWSENDFRKHDHILTCIGNTPLSK